MRIRFCKCDRQRCKYVVVRPDWVQSNLCFTVGSPRNYNSLGGKSLHHPPLETSQRSLLHLQMTSTPDSHDQILHNRAVCEVRRALKVGKHPHNVATQTSMSDKTHVFVSVHPGSESAGSHTFGTRYMLTIQTIDKEQPLSYGMAGARKNSDFLRE